MPIWTGKKIVILGAGKSGLAAARYLIKKDNQVVLSEYQLITEEIKTILSKENIPFEEGGHQETTLQQADIIITSPGIPMTAPPLLLAKKLGIPVISEIELAYQLTKIPCIAVTGSNGKTTTVSMIGELLQHAGLKAKTCGNIGTPMIELVEQNLDYLVVEISSFQLETMTSFRPYIGLFLNLYPNHLNRHETMDNYFQIKASLFKNQADKDWAIINLDNEWTAQLTTNLVAQQASFSQATQASHAWISGDVLTYLFQGQSVSICTLSELPLKGKHNIENYLAMLSVAAILGIAPEKVKQTIQGFNGVEHRLEKVATIKGRQFINDSKATNYLATIKALESIDDSILLIAGGEDKGGDFQPLAQIIQEKVKQVFLLGAAAQYFEEQLHQSKYDQTVIVKNMEEAVQTAFKHSQQNDIILLSPACTSYDMYQNFEQRGEDFKQHVANLKTK